MKWNDIREQGFVRKKFYNFGVKDSFIVDFLHCRAPSSESEIVSFINLVFGNVYLLCEFSSLRLKVPERIVLSSCNDDRTWSFDTMSLFCTQSVSVNDTACLKQWCDVSFSCVSSYWVDDMQYFDFLGTKQNFPKLDLRKMPLDHMYFNHSDARIGTTRAPFY